MRASSGAAEAKRVIVVGGGIGGLTCAAKLAKAGLSVVLLEQNEEVGGRCQTMHIDTSVGRFRFDTGPSLLLFPNVYKETFASLGKKLEDLVPIKRVQPAAYRVWFEGKEGPRSSPVPLPAGLPETSNSGGYLDLLYDVPAMIEQLETVEKGSGRAYLGWLSQARTALEVGVREFIARDFDSLLAFLDLRRLLPLLGQVDLAELLGQHNSRLASRFADPRLQALLTFQDLYVGLSPYTAPGAFSLLAATEITDGVYYPMGGWEKVKDGLASIATELGVSIRTSARVASVSTEAQHTDLFGLGQKHRATGVVLESGELLQADAVVSNRDVPLSFELLRHLPEAAAKQQRISSLDYSASVIAYNICLGKETPLLHHNVFLSNKGARSWERATNAGSLLPRPNFYVHCPTRSDESAAPAGCESVMVLLPVANLQEVHKANGGVSDDSEAALIQAGRDAIARTFAEERVCNDLWSHVLQERVIGPREWRDRYAIEHGAVFGLAHGLTQLAYFRPGANSTDVENFYLVGASARPGNGVPLVMISGDLTAQRVIQGLDKADAS